jgi:hypothetical protein
MRKFLLLLVTAATLCAVPSQSLAGEPQRLRVVRVEVYTLDNGTRVAIAEYAGYIADYPTLPTARSVPSQPFRPVQSVNSRYNPSHNCPTCGTAEYRIASWDRNGTHWHRCPQCATAWWHYDAQRNPLTVTTRR